MPISVIYRLLSTKYNVYLIAGRNIEKKRINVINFLVKYLDHEIKN